MARKNKNHQKQAEKKQRPHKGMQGKQHNKEEEHKHAQHGKCPVCGK